jgi:hypothetical protein
MPPSLHHDYPIAQTEQALPDVHPKSARLLIHTISTAIMANGFIGMTKLNIAGFIGPQVGHASSDRLC